MSKLANMSIGHKVDKTSAHSSAFGKVATSFQNSMSAKSVSTKATTNKSEKVVSNSKK